MESGPHAPGDLLQVIPRRSPAMGPADGPGTGSIRLQLPPARKQKLTRIVFAALAGCGLILVAAGIARMARANGESPASSASAPALPALGNTATAPTSASPAAAPTVAPATATDAPQTGTLRLSRPATPGKVWLDGQKLVVSSATVACGSHQLRIGAHGKTHAIDIPCGGELRVSH